MEKKIDHHPDITLFLKYKNFLGFFFQGEIEFTGRASEIAEHWKMAVDFSINGTPYGLFVERKSCRAVLYAYSTGMDFELKSPKHLVKILEGNG